MSRLATEVTRLLFAVSEQFEPELSPDTWYSKYHGRALELSSLQVIQLVDLIEATFDLVLTSDDVVREHFATPAALVARLRLRGLS